MTYKQYLGLNSRPSRDWNALKKLIKRWYIVRSSGDNDNSVILFGRHAGISSIIGVTAALGIAVGPIYQRGALKITLLYNYII